VDYMTLPHFHDSIVQKFQPRCTNPADPKVENQKLETTLKDQVPHHQISAAREAQVPLQVAPGSTRRLSHAAISALSDGVANKFHFSTTDAAVKENAENPAEIEQVSGIFATGKAIHHNKDVRA
jgi:hypothetical protein